LTTGGRQRAKKEPTDAQIIVLQEIIGLNKNDVNRSAEKKTDGKFYFFK